MPRSGAQPLILIADDQPDILHALRILLKSEGYRTLTASSPQEIMQAVAGSEPDLLLMDLNYSRDTTSGQEGLEILDRLRRLPAAPPVLVMTAWGSIDLAVEAMRRGAQDFVLKPWDNLKLVNTLRNQLGGPREARQQTLRDLALARQVQQEMLPQRPPTLSSLSIDAVCRQAGAVGGDAYDFFDLGPGRAAFALADISGKGLAAAMLMAHLIAALRILVSSRPTIESIIDDLNAQFRQATGPERFATVFYAEYDDATQILTYANCGHPPPFVLKASGEVARLQPTCPVVGILPVFKASSASIRLAPGDRVVIFSDGIPEAPTPNGDFGEEGLLQLLRENGRLDSRNLTERVAAATTAPQFDDMTLLIATAR